MRRVFVVFRGRLGVCNLLTLIVLRRGRAGAVQAAAELRSTLDFTASELAEHLASNVLAYKRSVGGGALRAARRGVGMLGGGLQSVRMLLLVLGCGGGSPARAGGRPTCRWGPVTGRFQRKHPSRRFCAIHALVPCGMLRAFSHRRGNGVAPRQL